MPHPLPQGKDSFKQFPTPGTEGLDYPRGMVTGQIEPCIIEELKFQVFRLFRRAKVSVKRVKRARHAHEERRGKNISRYFFCAFPHRGCLEFPSRFGLVCVDGRILVPGVNYSTPTYPVSYAG